MFKIHQFLAIAIIAVATFSGCSKKSDSSPSYSMKATVTGTGTANVNAANCVATTTSGALQIVGVNGSATSPSFPYVQIVAIGWNGTTGTINLDNTMTTAYAQYLVSATDSRISQSGSVVITSNSSTSISGTFSFTCADGTTVTNGTFTAKK